MSSNGVELGTGYVTILPSARGFEGKLASELKGSGATGGKTIASDMAGELTRSGGKNGVLGRAFGGIATVAAGTFLGTKGVEAVVGLFKGAMSEAKEAQVVGKQTEAVLKSTGGAAGVTAKQVGDLATSLSNKAAVDDELVQSGENVLLTFTKVRNEAGKGNDIFNQGTSIALDMSKALGTDLQGSVIQVGKALNDPIKGITALQRVGVSFTEDQKKQIKTLTESGHTLEAQKLILKELNTEFGGSAEAQATAGDRLKVVWNNVQETIGTKVMPIVASLSEWLAGVLPGAADTAISAVSWLTTQVKKGLGLISGPIKGIISAVGEAIDYFRGGVTGEFTGEGSGVLLFMNNLGTAIYTAWQAITTTVPKIISGVKGAVQQLVAGFTGDDTGGFFGSIGNGIRNAYDFVVEWIPKIKDGIIKGLGAVVDWVKNNWGNIKQGFTDALSGLVDGVSWVIDHKPILIGVLTAIGVGLAAIAINYAAAGVAAVASGIAAAAAWVVAAAPFIAVGVAIAGLVAGFVWLYQNVDAFRTAADAVAKAVVASFGWLRDNWRQIYDDIVNVIVTAAQVITNIVKAIVTTVQFIWDNFGNEIVAAITSIWRTISGVIDGAMRIIQGIIQTVMALIHGDWSGAWDGITKIFSGVWTLIQTILSAALDSIKITLSTAVSVLKVLWSPISDLLSYLNDKVVEPIKTKFTDLKNTVSDKITQAVDAAKTAWNGLTAIYNFFVQYIQTPIESAVTTLKDSIRSAFQLAVDGVKTIWNGLKAAVADPINIVIGFYNNGIAKLWNFVAEKVRLPTLGPVDPVKLATGGLVPGTGTGDTVRALLTPGEGVITVDAMKALGGERAINAINSLQPGDTVDPGVLGYAGGGMVRSLEDVQAWTQAQAGKPYVFPLVGPTAYDCSGFASALVNYALGLFPFARRFSSGSVGQDRALTAGEGDPTRGLRIGARPPYMTNSSGDFVGHVTTSIGTMNAEATPPRVRVGAGARGASALPEHYFLPGFGGPSQDEQSIIDTLKQLIGLHLPGLGHSPLADMMTKMFIDLPKQAFDFLVNQVPQIVKDAMVDAGVAMGTSANPLGTIVGIARSVFHFEKGGSVRQDGPILVGEGGPEIRWGSRGQYIERNGSAFGGVRDVHFHYENEQPTASQISVGIQMAQMGL
jgi:phage-related protein